MSADSRRGRLDHRASTSAEGGWATERAARSDGLCDKNISQTVDDGVLHCVEYIRGDGDSPVVRWRSAVPLDPAKQEEMSMTYLMRSVRPALRFRAFLAITVSIFITATVAVESRGQEKPDAPKVKKTGDKAQPKAKSGSGTKVDTKKGASNDPKRATRRKLQLGPDAPKGTKRKIPPPGVRAKRKPTAPRRTKGSAQFEMDPNAKWACEKTVVTLPPIWRRVEGVTFDFKIRNEGTADLRIRAKGG